MTFSLVKEEWNKNHFNLKELYIVINMTEKEEAVFRMLIFDHMDGIGVIK